MTEEDMAALGFALTYGRGQGPAIQAVLYEAAPAVFGWVGNLERELYGP